MTRPKVYSFFQSLGVSEGRHVTEMISDTDKCYKDNKEGDTIDISQKGTSHIR